MPPEAVAKWRAMKFGMFIHWGPVSLKGTELGHSRGVQVPIEEYDNLYKRFNPVKFDAGQWVKIAKDAGMKYVVLTTKHHDGFCMCDTKQTDYNIMHTPFGRDVLRNWPRRAAAGAGLRAYYSVCDWHHPDFPLGSPGGRSAEAQPNLDRYEQYLRSQVGELLATTGRCVTLWFDVAAGVRRRAGQGVLDFVRSLQPDILVNNRCAPMGRDSRRLRHARAARSALSSIERPWETCMTICNQWAWKPDDKLKSLGAVHPDAGARAPAATATCC